MRKVLIGGAGGAPSEGVIRSLNLLEKYHVIGLGSDPADIQLSQASERYLVPSSDNPSYKDVLLYRLRSLSPDFAHFQSDIEILRISSFRDQI
jgi:carbamoyl-phosphate synthase large subunit